MVDERKVEEIYERLMKVLGDQPLLDGIEATAAALLMLLRILPRDAALQVANAVMADMAAAVMHDEAEGGQCSTN
jgi:hypothetical protein